MGDILMLSRLLIIPAVILPLHARADDLDDAYMACQPHRHITDPHIGVTWDSGFEHCATDEAFYATRRDAPAADKDKHLANWRTLSKIPSNPTRALDVGPGGSK
jgi:hypothetical protein